MFTVPNLLSMKAVSYDDLDNTKTRTNLSKKLGKKKLLPVIGAINNASLELTSKHNFFSVEERGNFSLSYTS